ncbi:unnamed protein product [Caenorhabditis nigoni]|uniref:DUF38 domain-containing protein n=1 Tax=Caenorhabditis nigoni TaxID=1611254 RepID=A0A2G5VD05_9PELO|nr:hypothetical protein B9Z55_008125 [Caenorhabditis nigoni]
MESEFPEAVWKNLLKFMRFDQRASLSLHIPRIRSIETTVPLNLDYFRLEPLSLTIDTVIFDFYEFWNFWVPSPPSKKEVEEISKRKHIGNLFFRKADLINRWEKKVPIGITQGEAELKILDYLFGRFEKINIQRLRIDDVEDFLKRIPEKMRNKFLVKELHLAIQSFEEFQKVCGFLKPSPWEKLEFEIEDLKDFELEHIYQKFVKSLKIKFSAKTVISDVLDFLTKYESLKFPIGSKLTLEVPDQEYLDSIFKFFGISEKLDSETSVISENRKIFGGKVETYKNHIYEICEKWEMWIFEMEIN